MTTGGNTGRLPAYFIMRSYERQIRKWELFKVFYPNPEQWFIAPDHYIAKYERELERAKKLSAIPEELDSILKEK